MAREELDADYVIVGAGSAGCVLAARLSEDPGTKVVLLEAGGDDRPFKEPSQFLSNMWIHVPIGYSQTLKDPKVNWLYATEPDPGTGGRQHLSELMPNGVADRRIVNRRHPAQREVGRTPARKSTMAARRRRSCASGSTSIP